ncbi:UvrD-helicase domain-containing protein [Roseomonas mucosa]|uniref:UvrD-helicase domain-containing protein n=1 Tax=Roseomonas mucosa TaxID=207340 RepID=UPI001EF518E2|nr:UvrD-helicase domain-containing protein [Roseomonas mucosa]MCG7354636.1 UvrD-helicase domain-containing protein [Roseomonas mucosa]
MSATSETMERARLTAGLTASQREVAALHDPVLVLAGAGTGKTKTLTASVALRIAERGIPAGRILVVTFTNKGANENFASEARDMARSLLLAWHEAAAARIVEQLREIRWSLRTLERGRIEISIVEDQNGSTIRIVDAEGHEVNAIL